MLQRNSVFNENASILYSSLIEYTFVHYKLYYQHDIHFKERLVKSDLLFKEVHMVSFINLISVESFLYFSFSELDLFLLILKFKV